MNQKKYIYVDQNVVSPFYVEPVDFKVPEICQIVFSPALLDDVKGSNQPERHLASLDAMQAVMLKARLLGMEFFFCKGEDLHQEFLQVVNESRDFSFDTVRAHSCSGQHAETGRNEIEQPLKRFKDSSGSSVDPFSRLLNQMLAGTLSELSDLVEKAPPVERGNPLPGLIDRNYDRQTAIVDIWNDLPDSEKREFPTPELYFGFEASSGSLPWLFAMDMCCSTFDRLGYCAEAKRKNPAKQNNIQNDAKHIAYATQCDILLSSDKNLIYRAETIYSHLGLRCKPVLLGPEARLSENILVALCRDH